MCVSVGVPLYQNLVHSNEKRYDKQRLDENQIWNQNGMFVQKTYEVM